jgi:hypothetical protein
MAGLIATGRTELGSPWFSCSASCPGRNEPPGRGPSEPNEDTRADDYSAERRHRDGSRVTGLLCCARHPITAATVAKAP